MRASIPQAHESHFTEGNEVNEELLEVTAENAEMGIVAHDVRSAPRTATHTLPTGALLTSCATMWPRPSFPSLPLKKLPLDVVEFKHVTKPQNVLDSLAARSVSSMISPAPRGVKASVK